MKCPYCTKEDTEVIETRVSDDKGNIRRRRECTSCNKRFTTYERIESVVLIVKKNDGRREQFDREKLRFGIIKAGDKTSVSLDQINTIVDEIERELRAEDGLEVDSKRIGQLVAAKLKKIDKVAYIRFASVFKRFLDVEDFEKELRRLVR